jgi:hypothetical protein
VFYIIEKNNSLDAIQKLIRLGCYVDIIPTNFNYHPKLTSTVAVYIKLLHSDKGYIIPINHDEGINVDKERVYSILSSTEKLYTLNKKELLYHFNLQGAIDLSLLYSMSKYDKLEYSRLNKLINPFYSRYNDIANINQIIPLSKLYEVSENIYSSIKEVIDYEIPNGFDFYNKTATNVFFLLEQSGVGIKYDAFNSIFKPKNTLYNTLDNKVLTQYNLYNTTSRPTNSFNSVNFAAIPHTEEHRKCFTPANDYFVEFDFDGYHLRLLAEQIEYALTSDSAHKQLARLYFNKKEITDDEYKEAKQINFHAIYGKIPEKYSFLEIFTRIDDYIKELWKRYKDDGEVLAPISGKPFTASLKAMNPQKLMNYVMQSLETSRNIVVLKKLLKYLQTKKTTISLYTYDSIIMDFDKEDGKDTLENIKSIMEEGGKYPVSFKYSKDLSL